MTSTKKIAEDLSRIGGTWLLLHVPDLADDDTITDFGGVAHSSDLTPEAAMYLSLQLAHYFATICDVGAEQSAEQSA